MKPTHVTQNANRLNISVAEGSAALLSKEALWGFVSNGLKLRLLRDNHSITRQAYVEFDLAAMMDGQAFSDFVLLWLLCHQSRVETEPGGLCWLEKWATAAREQGTRALDELRDGVERAIEALGRGFLKHQANRTLLERLRAGTLDRQDYYRQLLRLVYRLIFLLVAEARELLLVAEPTSATAERYRRYYSITRLRGLAGSRRGTPHGDLWQSLLVVIRGLSSSHGCPELGLPALGSLLWSDAAAPDLNSCQLSNLDLLNAIRALGFRIERGMRRTVDWRNLGAEELGSVYESLLELHPDVNTAAATFSLRVAAGHERKTTGSYYTPTSLVECLLDSALDPVLDQAAKATDPEGTILHLKVCDPACGSGHFLIAAAHRIARRLAAVRTGDAEASPDAVRHALRDVIGHCVYGVDVNEMAVELCKVNLWLEALDPGKPLSFLDQRIQCGNSLLGAAPALLRSGIPDGAFEAMEGDDPEQCRFLKRSNRLERDAGFQSLANAEAWQRVGDLATGIAALEEIDDSTLDGVHRMETRYAELVRSASYECGKLWADSWCAAFVWPKTKDAHPLTEDMFRIIERNPMAAPEPLRNGIRAIANQYQFFHWHLAFPQVFHVLRGEGPLPEGPGWAGGFDVVLGNPPWERIKIQEKEWFSERRPDITEAPNAAARKRIIQGLKDDDPALWKAWCEALRQSDGESSLVRSTGRYPLCGRGDINTYAVFAELNRTLLNQQGQAGFIVPTGIATDDTTKFFFQDLVECNSLISLYDFQSGPGLFSAIGHARFKFALVTLAVRRERTKPIDFAFFLRRLPELQDPGRRFTLTADDIALLNPNTLTCPIFRTQRDAEVTKQIYRVAPVLIHEVETRNPWAARFQAMFHMSGDSTLFRTATQLEGDGWTLRGNVFEHEGKRYLPLYEAKMVHQYTHRFGDYAGKRADDEGLSLPEVAVDQLASADYTVRPRYWVPENAVEDRLRNRWEHRWLFGLRQNARSTDERTFISSVMPLVGCGHSIILLLPGATGSSVVLLLSNLSSFAFDYVARQKLGGSNISYYIIEQLPALPPAVGAQPCPWHREGTLSAWIAKRVLELSYTSWNLQPFAASLSWEGPPFRWNPARRNLLRCELDAAFFHLYDIGRDDVDYIMETFHIVRGDDQAAYGEYRTKRMILEIYDAMQRAIETGEPFKTILDPPSADPSCCHPKKTVGILAFGSLIHDPGLELKRKIAMRIRTMTPFGVEYGRYSGKTRGGGPTLVPHPEGSPVAAEILVIDDDVTIEDATNMLWRRETGKIGNDETYTRGTSANSVLVERFADDGCVETVLYTDFNASGKIDNPTAAALAKGAIQSVAAAQVGKDGITYLADAISGGIETPLTSAYRAEILQQTKAASLEEALRMARNGSD